MAIAKSDAHFENIDRLSRFLDEGVLTAMVQAQTEFAAVVQAELPGQNLKNVVKKRPITKQGNKYTASVSIDDQSILKYLWAYWKGVPNTVTIVAHHKFMVFDRWANGPNNLRWNDGKFHFQVVHRTYAAHDFVSRAIFKFTARFYDIVNRNVTIGFK